MGVVRAPASSDRSVAAVDIAKGVALAIIVFSHLAERFGANPAFFNPAPGWPSFGEQVAQLVAPAGPGVIGVVFAVLRDIAWLGDIAVGLFIVLSGFGLGWGLARSGRLDVPTFVRRRVGRVYPMWLTVHALFAVPLVLLGSVSVSAAVLSALGIRFLPSTYYAIVPAWWFVGLLLQLYAVTPLLWWAAQRFGPARMMAGAIVLGLAARGIGLPLAGSYVDEWSRGAIFLTRLPEFAFGLGFALVCRAQVANLRAFALDRRMIVLAALAFSVGLVASMTLAGMVIAPLCTSFGAFVLVFAVALRRPTIAPVEWIGKHSYSLYLCHQVTILLLVRGHDGPLRTAAEIALAIVTGVALALFVEWLTARLERGVAALGAPRTALVAAALVALVYGSEAAVRTFDPQEIYGAGERPSLVADADVTYKLKPNATTHLRWQTYDYVVQANSLGFPAPEPPRKRAGVTTVMSLGNAFTSAEGVSTPDSWPRLIARNDPRFAVADFAITGHGPNQWAEVVRAYGPRIRPDVIVVQMWVKDFSDAMVTDDQMRAMIGFGEPSPSSPKSFLQLAQTKAWLHNRVVDPLLSALHHKPDPIGYELGGFQYFRTADAASVETTGYAKTLGDIASIRDEARSWGGRVVIAMFPASIQVCSPDQLPYYPRYVNFADRTQYDPDRPQRLAARLAATLHLDYVDLRDAFRGTCRFAPHNMHLTADGQRLASDYLGRVLNTLAPANIGAR